MMHQTAGGKKSRGGWAIARLITLGLSFAAATLLGAHAASASTRHHRHTALHEARRNNHIELASTHRYRGYRHHEYTGYRIEYAEYRYHREYGHYRYLRYATHYRHSGIQCVPYAREVSHIDLSGNAFLWWAEAAGRYARGNTPQEGAVLNFRAIGRMPLGHVAVVTSVINSRTILVTQANWVRGTITNDVTMQDVSPNNDWTQVQVELGDSSTWGAAYPTYGFIYNHPPTATIIAASGQGNEVAEAPTANVATDAPDRDLQ
jgi:surface antigen